MRWKKSMSSAVRRLASKPRCSTTSARSSTAPWTTRGKDRARVSKGARATAVENHGGRCRPDAVIRIEPQ
jgi:hypothetical protein